MKRPDLHAAAGTEFASSDDAGAWLERHIRAAAAARLPTDDRFTRAVMDRLEPLPAGRLDLQLRSAAAVHLGHGRPGDGDIRPPAPVDQPLQGLTSWTLGALFVLWVADSLTGSGVAQNLRLPDLADVLALVGTPQPSIGVASGGGWAAWCAALALWGSLAWSGWRRFGGGWEH